MTATMKAAAAMALAVTAAPALAQITADELWAAQTATLAQFGFQIAGTLSRDGAVVTLSDATATYVLPLGAGEMTVTLNPVLMTESADGTVSTGFGPDFGGILRLSTFGMELATPFDIVVRNLTRISSGTPGAIRTTTEADLISIELPEIRIGDAMSGGGVTAMFFVAAQGVSQVVETTGLPPTAIHLVDSTDRLVTDYQFNAYGTVVRDVAEYHDLASDTTLTLGAAPLNILDLGAALRDGFSAVLTSTSGPMQSQMSTHIYDELRSSEYQTARATDTAMRLTTEGAHFSLAVRDITYSMSFDGAAREEFGATARQGDLRMDLPLLAGMGQQTALMVLDIAGLEVSNGVWLLMGARRNPPDLPFDMSVAGRAVYEPLIDLTDVVRLGEMIDGDRAPVLLQGFWLDALEMRLADAVLTGTGNLFWDGGAPMDTRLPPPAGGAEMTLTGAYALIDRITASGAVSADLMLGLRGGLAALGRASGPDQLHSTFEISPTGNLLVNGAPVPF